MRRKGMILNLFRYRAQRPRSHKTQCEFKVLFDSFSFKKKNQFCGRAVMWKVFSPAMVWSSSMR
jgi:hypothetical protein